MTSSGFEIPPDQNASQIRSTLLLNAPVITRRTLPANRCERASTRPFPESEPASHTFWGKPRLSPPWLGSSQRLVTTLPRVKKWMPSMPWACESPKREFFQPPKE